MLHARKPTEEERAELQQMRRQAVGRVSQRAHMVLLSIQGQSVPVIAIIFQTSRATVRFWIKRYNTEGPDGLYDEPRSGRPSKVNASVQDTLVDCLEEDPLEEGSVATFWTVAMLVLVLIDKLGISLSFSTVRSLLHKMGLHWGRPRLAMPTKTDPEKAQKQWQIAKAVVQAPENAAILYSDEARIELLPIVRAMWHWVGQQIRIPTPGSNVTQAIFGALNVRTGQWTYLLRDHMRKEDFIAFLEYLLAVYVEVPIILIVDNYSSHTAYLVRDWLAQHPCLQLYYLPKYCSDLNPVENIWLRLKNKVAANRLYASFQLLLEAVDRFFREMSPEQALDWAAAYK
jgi:transposase